MDGTLLGAYRDRDFCENDEDDIDVGLLSCDYDRYREIVSELLPQGFTMQKPLSVRGRLEGFGFFRGKSHIDVVRINLHQEKPERFNWGRTHGAREIIAFVYPESCHRTFSTLCLHGIECPIPGDPELFLRSRYGDWKTPIPRPGFIWWKDANRSSIRHNYDDGFGEIS